MVSDVADPHEVDFPRPSALAALPEVCAMTGSREDVERVRLAFKWSIATGPVRLSATSVLKNVRDERVQAYVPLSRDGRRRLQRLRRLEWLGALCSSLLGVSFCAIPILATESGLGDAFAVPALITVLVSAPLPWLLTHLRVRKRKPRVRPKGLVGFALFVPDLDAARAYREALWGTPERHAK